MVCVPFTTPDGARGFMCGPAKKLRCACGMSAPFLCDWKTPGGPKATCDAPLCGVCAYQPVPGKDLCPAHAAEWRAMLAKHYDRTP